MKYLTEYSTAFDAGHRYTLTVTWEREGFPADVDQKQAGELVSVIQSLRYELANRELAKMLGPHHPSVWGVAAFFMERLKIHGTIEEVRVHESDSDLVAIIRDDTDY